MGNICTRHTNACGITQCTADSDGLAAGQIDIARFSIQRIASDLRIAADCNGTLHIYTTTTTFNTIPGNLTARHVELAVVPNIYRSLVSGRVSVISIAADFTAIHIKTAKDIHDTITTTIACNTATVEIEIGAFSLQIDTRSSCSTMGDFSIFCAVALAVGQREVIIILN